MLNLNTLVALNDNVKNHKIEIMKIFSLIW